MKNYKNVTVFYQELIDLKSTNPLIIAFNNHSFKILDKHLKNKVEKIFCKEGL
jgi:hypothetical protein